jgi:hypothetical protein
MNVFVFTEGLGVDYLGNLVVAELLANPNMNVYITEIPHFLFPDCYEKTNGMYGMGYTITKKVPLKYKNAVVVHEDYIEELLSQKTMDLIVYASIRRKFRPPHRRLEWKHPKQPCDFFHIVTKYYPKEKIIAFEGEDDNNFLEEVIDKVTYYKRELLPQDIHKAHPVSFSFPSYWSPTEEYLEKNKVYILAEYNPNNPGKKFETEQEYYKQYSKALFGYTMKKAGWDCLRHYEILGAGALPYFENIEEKPETIMSTWPIKLQKDVNALCDKLLNKKNYNSPPSQKLGKSSFHHVNSVPDKDLNYYYQLHKDFNDWFQEYGKTSIYSKILMKI